MLGTAGDSFSRVLFCQLTFQNTALRARCKCKWLIVVFNEEVKNSRISSPYKDIKMRQSEKENLIPCLAIRLTPC